MLWSVKARVKTCHSGNQCVLLRFWRSKMFWSCVAFVFVGRVRLLFWSKGKFVFWVVVHLPVSEHWPRLHERFLFFSPGYHALVTCSLPSVREYIPIIVLILQLTVGSIYVQLYCPCRISPNILCFICVVRVYTLTRKENSGDLSLGNRVVLGNTKP